MNMLILAAGYATRLYPLTKDKAKPLLEVAGKPMIEWVLESFSGVLDLESVYIVTNNKFAQDFQKWAEQFSRKQPQYHFKIINDGSMTDEDKLGAIGDMHLVINQEDLFVQDLLVVAGDNLFNKKQLSFIEFARDKMATIATYDTGSLEEIKKYASIVTADSGKISDFIEKPESPESTMAGIALYYYRQDCLPLINQYINEGNNPDQPGRLIEWLYKRVDTYGYPIEGIWYDIGSKENLAEADAVFSEFVKETPTR